MGELKRNSGLIEFALCSRKLKKLEERAVILTRGSPSLVKGAGGSHWACVEMLTCETEDDS